MRVLGLKAIGGQFFPPHSDGQNDADLSVPGLRSGSTSGRPVFGSRLLYTFCRTKGVPSTKRISPLERSRNHRYPSRATSVKPFPVFPLGWESTRIGGDTSSQSHDSFGSYW